MRQRRIGTITLGVSLVLFGILFMIRIFGGVLNYTFVAVDFGCTRLGNIIL